MEELSQKLLAALREHIGTRGNYSGKVYELIEVLEHESAIVLRDCSPTHTIQNDLYGEAHRIVGKTHTLPVFSEASNELHPAIKDFFSEKTLSIIYASSS